MLHGRTTSTPGWILDSNAVKYIYYVHGTVFCLGDVFYSDALMKFELQQANF